jgi:hypothetical protein
MWFQYRSWEDLQSLSQRRRCFVGQSPSTVECGMSPPLAALLGRDSPRNRPADIAREELGLPQGSEGGYGGQASIPRWLVRMSPKLLIQKSRVKCA